jgi:glyoxylase-like metal-dependent hydrolase (beta-lactamase superfamily II)
MSHLRSEDRFFWDALDEIIAIGRVNRMPVQVSHLKLGMHDLWGQADKAIAILDRARAAGVQITADVYPYTYWQSNLGVLYPKRNFSDAAETAFVLGHVSLPDDIIFNSFRAHPDYVGKTLADVARMRGTTPEQTLMALLAEPGGESTGIVAKGMADADVERLMQWPFANVCSDGQSFGLHPRGFGSFAKVLGPYVRDRKLFGVEEAVRKMTSLAAADVGLLRRGRVAPNLYADLVLFDPATVADRADFGKAQAQAVGIHTVWVNGQIVFQDGKTTGAHPGRPLRRQKAAPARSTAERGTLPARWTAATSDCTNAPPFVAHEYNRDLLIIRQSGCTNFEKPFLYLLFGSAQAMLVDTGARGADVSGIVQDLRQQHADRNGGTVVPLTVVHSHGHGDHTAGDAALTRLANTRVIEAKPDRVAEFFGIQNWPRELAQYDLGSRILDIVPIPGHEPASIAIYDRRTAILLTGDTVYPGRLYVRDPDAFRDSIDRLTDFTATRTVSHVLGAHIENTRTPYRDYPQGTTYQPEEHVLELARSNVVELRDALHQMGSHLERRAYRDFTVWPVEAR